jgi:hypothetical protein
VANPTTNYGFVLPTPTDLVTDLPADFDVALQGVDTRLKALQPGTTLGDIAYSSATADTNTRLPIGTSGQVLAVSGGGVPAWTTTADVTPLTTKGDLFTFTTVDARLGVGANDTVLTADSAEATGMKWATPAPGGGMTSVASGTLSGTAVAITGIPSTYKQLRLVVTNYRPTTDNQSLRLRVNNDASANSYMQDFSSSATSAFGSTLWNIASNVDNGASEGIIVLDIYSYNEATWKMGFNQFINNNATTSTSGSYGASFLYYNNTTTISQLNLFNSGGGDFTSGNYVVYGVN